MRYTYVKPIHLCIEWAVTVMLHSRNIHHYDAHIAAGHDRTHVDGPVVPVHCTLHMHG